MDTITSMGHAREHGWSPAAEGVIRAYEAARRRVEAAILGHQSSETIHRRLAAVQRSAAAVRLVTGLDIDLQHRAWEARHAQ